MKAVRYHSYGASDVLVREDVDRPVPAAGEVVIEVAGTAFNPVDIAIRAGYLQQEFTIDLPHIPNFDVAGVIAELGQDVDGWSVGDAVVALLPLNGSGAAAEFVVAPANVLAAAPRTVDLADAAALPAVGLTAWQVLFEHAELKPGQTVLVNGAGGGVGGYVVQLAKQAGATVTATAGPRSTDRIRSYGADQVVDYTATPVAQALDGRRFDVVVQLVRSEPDEIVPLASLVAEGGVFVTTTTPGGEGVRTAQVGVHSDAAQLAELVGRVDSGVLRIDVAQRRPLTELAAVHDEAAAGTLLGKTVLIP